MVLVFNGSDKTVQWVFSECSEPHDHTVAPGFGVGVGGAEAEFVAKLAIPGVRIGPGADEVSKPRPNTQERKKGGLGMMFVLNTTPDSISYTFGVDRVLPPSQGYGVAADEAAYVASLALVGVTVVDIQTSNTSSPVSGRGVESDDATTSQERTIHPRSKSSS